ncbi:MAG: hypothetical protein U0Y82_01980 [Thermoleophilia bacterium]
MASWYRALLPGLAPPAPELAVLGAEILLGDWCSPAASAMAAKLHEKLPQRPILFLARTTPPSGLIGGRAVIIGILMFHPSSTCGW